MFFWLKYSFKSALRRSGRTLIIFSGLSLAVVLLSVLGSIMTGVNDRMVENSVSLYTGHVVADGGPFPLDQAEREAAALIPQGEEELVAALPRFLAPVLLKKNENTAPVMVSGLYPEREKGVSLFPDLITGGKWLDGGGGLVLGSRTAEQLEIEPGDKVGIIGFGRISSLEVTGIFDSGIDGFDGGNAFMDVRRMGEITGSDVSCSVSYYLRSDDSAEFSRDLKSRFAAAPFRFSTWEEKLPEVAQLVKLNRASMNVVVFLVVLIFGFGIANTLVVSLVDRYREFAILRAVGVKPRELALSIVGESFFICLAAGIAGTAGAYGAVALLHHTGIDLSAYTSSNPHFSVNSLILPRFTFYSAVVPQALALFAGILASLWPAVRIAGEEIVTHLRDL